MNCCKHLHSRVLSLVTNRVWRSAAESAEAIAGRLVHDRASRKRWLVVLASLVPLAGPRGMLPERTALAAGHPVEAPRSRHVTRVYYVAPNGSDAGRGSSSAPFRSIQQAADVARAGDTVIVRPGRYTGGDRLVSLGTSGKTGAWITFRSEISWKAVLDGQGDRSLVAWYFGPGVGYIRIQGFDIRDLHEHGFDFYGGAVHDVLVAGNHVHHIGRNCTDTQNGRTGAAVGANAERVTFDGNVWDDIGRLAPGELGCDPSNTYYQNHDHGIYVADANQITIINNVFYSFARGWAIHRYFSRGTSSHGLLIANNTFTGANPYRAGQIILATATTDLRIENNIFVSPQTAALWFEDLAFPDGVVRYNMVNPGALTRGRPTGIEFSHNWEGVDPRFVSRLDVRLKPGSPAIDVGSNLPEVAHDALGVIRPRGRAVDLGAYER